MQQLITWNNLINHYKTMGAQYTLGEWTGLKRKGVI